MECWSIGVLELWLNGGYHFTTFQYSSLQNSMIAGIKDFWQPLILLFTRFIAVVKKTVLYSNVSA